MSCEKTAQVHAYYDDELPRQQRGAVEAHLQECADCRALLAELHQVSNLIAAAPLAPMPQFAFARGYIFGTGSGSATVAAPPTTGPAGRGPVGGGRGWLPSELNLNAEQQDKMKQIWSEVAGHGRGEQEDRRRQLRHDRDDAIAA